MSFWSKKPETPTIPDTVTEKLSEITNTHTNIELRLQKLEEGSKKIQFVEINTRIDEIAASTQKRFEDVQHQILSVTDSIPIVFKEYKKLIEDLQKKQCILEERIAVYDEKLEKLKELEEQSKKPIVSNNSPTGYKPSPLTRALAEQNNVPSGPVSTMSPTGPPPKVAISGTGGTKQPSWVKKKEELSPTINDTVVRDA